MNALYLFAALAAGIGIAVQAAVNSRLAAGLGSQPLMGALISFAVGTLALALIACWQADWPQALAQAGRQPWWHWTGGLLGACFVFMTVFLAPRIGLTQMAFIMIVGQLLMGLLIDSHGLLHMPARPVTVWKYAGLALMLAGLAVFSFGPKLAERWG